MINNIKFPTAKEVLVKRLKKDGLESEESFNAISENSAICKSIESEIEIAKMSLSNIMAQVSLLAIPVQIPSAIKNIESQLPMTVKMLQNLDVDTGSVLDNIDKSINVAKNVLKTAGLALSNPILAPLKSLLGF